MNGTPESLPPKLDEKTIQKMDELIEDGKTYGAARDFLLSEHKRFIETGGRDGVRLVFPPGTDLTGATFDGVRMHGCGLRGADMTGSGTDAQTRPPNGFTRVQWRAR